MSPILLDLPTLSNDQFCTPISSSSIYCFTSRTGNNYINRYTLNVVGSDLVVTRLEHNTYNGYDVSTYPTSITNFEIYPELGRFWFPLISVFCIFLIFYFVYRVLFRRFIK